jgi:hypothetical protein
MVAVKAGNNTHVAVDIEWIVSQMDCLCEWQFMNCFLMIQNCLYGVVACHIGHLDEPFQLSSVEICSSTCSVNKDGGKQL